MQRKVLVTGSEGLIGSALIKELEGQGIETSCLDILAKKPSDRGDVRDYHAVSQAMTDCTGVIHLAAVSRVIWGEHKPEMCWETNVKGTENVLKAASGMQQKPWVIYGSSREVYGQPESLPVSEDTPLTPVNIYGRSKVASEELVNTARLDGLATAIVRFSNVYGSTSDHSDRVIPAFSRAASLSEPLRIDGQDHIFDFNHLEDTIRGLMSLITTLDKGASGLPPIHFVTGVPTTLGELANMAIELAKSDSQTVLSPPRTYDVARFVGNPSRAKDLLGWTPQIGIREGLQRLIQDFRELERCSNKQEGEA